ncbi:hypothetical protein O181_106226 [Austropuccinia psidii MF-1]|uniref:Ubiquinol-cytochrome c chaperone domain-containing protein n=1 Tax=Austropuccinia psidii MF-1 TaxID=1389203 RepID=A0A9Q3PN23_9BASI|nr:hypothetical protein [Austropuccinia psidii MF-1]
MLLRSKLFENVNNLIILKPTLRLSTYVFIQPLISAKNLKNCFKSPSYQLNRSISSIQKFSSLNNSRQAEPVRSPPADLKNSSNVVVGRSGKIYSKRTVKLVEMIGRLLGYNLKKSTAITLTSDYYDRCANAFELQKDFWVGECGLPDSFQTWFQITQLHMWLLTVRFRAMPPPLGKLYTQEFVNHAFLDTEHRMRGPKNKVTKNTLVKKYMQIMLQQHRGIQIGLDWAIAREKDSDQMLAAAIWRNIFGAAWGRGMGGVKGIFSCTTQNQDPQNTQSIDQFLTPSFDSLDQSSTNPNSIEGDLKFAEILKRSVTFIRKELIRLDQVSDKMIVSGQSPNQQDGLTSFGKI